MRILPIFFFTLIALCAQSQSIIPGWPQTNRQAKPWTRWWWHGSAVTKEGITKELEALKSAGLGGVEITPIYGVHGFEKDFVKFLSPEWMELLTHVLQESERLDLGVDMATGTGWPFGGPWVTEQDACKNLQYKIYELKSGESLSEKIQFVQPPYLRAIGSSIYESNTSSGATLKEPFKNFQSKQIDIKKIQDPIGENPNLQSYAFDQVQFEKNLPLQTLMAYSNTGKSLDLTKYVTGDGRLNWKASKGDWKLYAVFQGWHGKMVERAAPGGEGNVLDHFSPQALDHYFSYFDRAFQGHDLKNIRAFFNDSYEVDDGKGAADWTPALFQEFLKRRGYDLRLHLPALFGKDTEDKNERILSDYRLTISEILQEHFTKKWKTWAATHGALVRNQAHGSPANILDLYGVVDIPEIEGTEPLRIKMASSAGNVMGKPLVSSESATWLNDHFESNLHDVKEALDRFMLNGVNHLFYHGTCYSPENEPWPGWLFYAAVHFNDRNPQWNHFVTLNNYVERCQSFLQNTKADNDVLLYYPVYDRFVTRGPKMIEHFDGIGRQFEGSSFAMTAEALMKGRYGFDYISDAQILKLSFADENLISEGNSHYKTLIIPGCRFMPVSTLEKINSLIKAGVNVIFMDGLPKSFPGFADYQKMSAKFGALSNVIKSTASRSGNVKIHGKKNPESVLEESKIPREKISEELSFIRKKQVDGTKVYFINNQQSEFFEGWVTFQANGKSVIVYDPMTGEYGKAKVKNSSANASDVYLQLEPKQSVLVQFFNNEQGTPDIFYSTNENPLAIEGEWHVEFISGGPTIPSPLKLRKLDSWTTQGSACSDFSGTAVYRINFPKPLERADTYMLDLGMVKESASVSLNGKKMGTLIGPSYKIKIDAALLKETNALVIEVANLMANRIAYMDRNRIFWKKFYNVNFAALKAENRLNGIFDASQWKSRDSGLLGPVTITPVKEKNSF
jgi:hypothetical protein